MKSRYEILKEREQNWKEIQWVASETRNASQLFRAQEELEKIWRELDTMSY